MFRSQDIQVIVFLNIPWFTKSMTSWWVLVHETGYIFEYIFWTTTHWVTKRGQLIDINKGNDFQESFEQFGGRATFQVLFNLAACSNYLITNYIKIPVFDLFEKVNKGQLKRASFNY